MTVEEKLAQLVDYILLGSHHVMVIIRKKFKQKRATLKIIQWLLKLLLFEKSWAFGFYKIC